MMLDLASSEELVSELFRRYPDAVFVGMKEHPTDDSCIQTYQRFQGHLLLVQGMLTQMIHVVQATENYPKGEEGEL